MKQDNHFSKISSYCFDMTSNVFHHVSVIRRVLVSH